MNKIVIDSNVFFKIIANEQDSLQAENFFNWSLDNEIKLYAPKLFEYEIASITQKAIKENRFDKTINEALSVVDLYKEATLSVIEPTKEIWLKAEEISSVGHLKSGFPSIYDSIYHAMAVKMNSVFLTADGRHYDKTKKIGNILLLENWESLKISGNQK